MLSASIFLALPLLKASSRHIVRRSLSLSARWINFLGSNHRAPKDQMQGHCHCLRRPLRTRRKDQSQPAWPMGPPLGVPDESPAPAQAPGPDPEFAHLAATSISRLNLLEKAAVQYGSGAIPTGLAIVPGSIHGDTDATAEPGAGNPFTPPGRHGCRNRRVTLRHLHQHHLLILKNHYGDDNPLPSKRRLQIWRSATNIIKHSLTRLARWYPVSKTTIASHSLPIV